MRSAKDKILLFNEIVLKDAISERDQILTEIKEETERDISEAKARCEKLSVESFLAETRRTEEEKNKIIHDAFGKSRELLDKTRQEIISKVMDKVKIMIKEYRGTQEYYKYICKSVHEFMDENKNTSICIYLHEEDQKAVLKICPELIETNGVLLKKREDMYGGVILKNMDTGMIKDNSFASGMEKYKDIFMEGL